MLTVLLTEVVTGIGMIGIQCCDMLAVSAQFTLPPLSLSWPLLQGEDGHHLTSREWHAAPGRMHPHPQ